MQPTKITDTGKDYREGPMAGIQVPEVISSSIPIIRWIRSPKSIISNQKAISVAI